MTQHAIVIGSGIVGMACALHLLEQGFMVSLIEREAPVRGASWGNAGHIAVEQTAPLASMATIRSFPRRLFSRGGALSLPPRDIARWLPFSLRMLNAARPNRFAAGQHALKRILAQAMPAWRRLDASCAKTSLLVEDGHFILWESAETARAGRTAWLSADSGTATFRDATVDELATLGVLTHRKIAGAVRCEGSGRVADPSRLLDELHAAFVAGGGIVRQASVSALPLRGVRAEVRLENGEMLRPDIVIVASGAASGDLLTPLGHHVPIIAERGYHVQASVSEAEWPIAMPPVVFEDRSMIVTRFESGLRAASFVEFSSLTAPPDPRKWQRLHSHIEALGLPLGEHAAQWIGARPTLPDYLPAIGRSDRAANLIYAFGHQHLGLTLGPITGEIVAALAIGKTPPVDPADFSLNRFGRARG